MEGIFALGNFFATILGLFQKAFLFLFKTLGGLLSLSWEVLRDILLFFASVNPDFTFFKAVFLDIFFIGLWAVFFIYYAIHKSIKFKYLFFALFLGVLAAFLSFFGEKFLMHDVFSNFTEITMLKTRIDGLSQWNVVQLFLVSFFFVALIEEGIKFLILKKYVKLKGIDQVVDGMKVGIWLGLGFAFLENLVYYINFIDVGQLTFANVIGRGLLSTLAHCLFGALMGYYLVLSKLTNSKEIHFRIVNQQDGRQVGVPENSKPHAEKVGFFIPLLAHGFFNFFLFLNLGIYSLIMISAALVVNLIWYGKKKNMELYFNQGGTEMIFSPDIASAAEIKVMEDKELTDDEKREVLLMASKENKN